jgi:beta-N-acetylglucosaminidase
MLPRWIHSHLVGGDNGDDHWCMRCQGDTPGGLRQYADDVRDAEAEIDAKMGVATEIMDRTGVQLVSLEEVDATIAAAIARGHSYRG